MSFDLERAGKDEAFWQQIVQTYGKKLLDKGWQGPLQPDQLEVGKNWDLMDDILGEAVYNDGEEAAFEESDGGGIPGSADCVTITKLCGKFFVTGSYLVGGPYGDFDEAENEAGLGDG